MTSPCPTCGLDTRYVRCENCPERATDAHLRQTRYRRVGTTSVAEHYCGACGAPWTDDHHCSRVTGTREGEETIRADERSRIMDKAQRWYEAGIMERDAYAAVCAAVLISDEKPGEDVFRYFQRLHGLPETGSTRE